MPGRNNRSMTNKSRMEKLEDNYDLFLSGKITGAEFINYVRINLIESNGSGTSNNKTCCNSSK
jgi:hypothetical protein